ncbi:MAG TPA: hypothetical protein VF631_03040 [Allosphingosinicella sp.]|jgi:hypothetical protein|uniref:hypothetical protein n=1 Tax=Allosphingosinicella sp. TaxID=2823234 RepID=UPI002F26FB42
MRHTFAAAALLLLAAAPAHATQGLLCRALSSKVPRISLVIGAGGIAGASLDENGRWLTLGPNTDLRLTQAWIDGEQVLADIVGPTWDRVARLRARFEPPVRGMPRSARGTLTLRGRTFAVRCKED